MKKERILAYQLAQKLDDNHLQTISGASFSCGPKMTYDPYGNKAPTQDGGGGCSYDPWG